MPIKTSQICHPDSLKWDLAIWNLFTGTVVDEQIGFNFQHATRKPTLNPIQKPKQHRPYHFRFCNLPPPPKHIPKELDIFEPAWLLSFSLPSPSTRVTQVCYEEENGELAMRVGLALPRRHSVFISKDSRLSRSLAATVLAAISSTVWMCRLCCRALIFSTFGLCTSINESRAVWLLTASVLCPPCLPRSLFFSRLCLRSDLRGN